MTPQEYNELFSKLNGVPLNAKWAPEGQMAYLKGLLAIQARNGTRAYQDPDKYAGIGARVPTGLGNTTTQATPSPVPQFQAAPSIITLSLQDALRQARATVKVIEDLIARGA